MSGTQTPYAGLTAAGVVLVKTVNYITTNAGNPNGLVAGQCGSASLPPDQVWDYQGQVLYICTVTGAAATAVWSPVNYPGAASIPNVTLTGNPTVTGGLKIGGGLSVGSASTLTGMVNTGTLANTGTMTQTGPATFSSSVSVTGALTGAAGIFTSLTNSGTLVQTGNVGAAGNVALTGTAATFSMTGTSAALSMGGGAATIALSGSASVLTIGGNQTLTGSLTTTGGIVGQQTTLAAGIVGQSLTATNSGGSLASGTITALCSIVLGRGNWLVWPTKAPLATAPAAVTVNDYLIAVNGTSASLSGSELTIQAAGLANGAYQAAPGPAYFADNGSSQTAYMNLEVITSSGTTVALGASILQAVRLS